MVRKGLWDEARASLRRVRAGNTPNEEIEEALALIEYTNKMEAELNEKSSYLECFRGKNLWRTEIVSVSIFEPILGQLLIRVTNYRSVLCSCLKHGVEMG